MSDASGEDDADAPESEPSESDAYVHRPSGEPPDASAERTFGWRGWVLVAALVFAFLVVPVALLALPHARSFVANLGLTWWDAYLVLPLAPAVLLGVVAVWSAVRSRAR